MKEKLVFFGSGPVAAKALRLLHRHFDIEAIITKPSTLLGMQSLEIAPVHAVASKSELDEIINNASFSSPLAVLIDFGIIVSQKVIDYFPLGIINSHFSLLPQWRGADPITFAILSGQKQTGVSLMLLVEKMDEGPLLSQGLYDIQLGETTPSLTSILISLSDALLAHAIPKYIAGEIVPRSQKDIAKIMKVPFKATYSRKLIKQDGLIDWSKPAEVIEREIRAYLEWPKSHTKFGNIDLIIIKASVVKCANDAVHPGEIKISQDGNRLMVASGDGCLSVMELRPIGKNIMPIADFLNGYRRRIGIKD